MKFGWLVMLVFFTPFIGEAQPCSVVSSHASGWFTEAFLLQLQPSSGCPEGSIIYVQSGGETPGLQSDRYQQPITITDPSDLADRFTRIRTTIPNETSFLDRFLPPKSDVNKAYILRAVVYHESLPVSSIVSWSFFFDVAPRYTYPVFSIITDPSNLFDDDTGIYVPGNGFNGSNFTTSNFAQSGEEWERPIHITMLASDGTLNVAMDAGARIHGGFSRRAARKSLRIYTRNAYSESRFPWPLLENRNAVEYRRFLLRNSGQQVYSSLFLDDYNNRLLRGSDFIYTESSPAIVYLNGEYWGIHNIREFQDEHFLESLTFVNRNEIDFLENYLEVRSGSASHYEELLAFVAGADLTDSAQYDRLNEYMDVQNYIDYFIYQMFIANVDWPGYNIRYWRKQTPAYIADAPQGHDGRWRWVVHDTDGGIGNATSWTTNMYDVVSDPAGPSWPNPPWSTLKFRKLSENLSFRDEFISRVADFHNSVFRQSYMEAQLDSFVAVYAPELPDHIHRWQRPASLADWNESIIPIRNFIRRRQSVFLDHTAAYFGISREMVPLTVQHPDHWKGQIVVNRLPLVPGYPGIDAQPFPWTGEYFRGQTIQLRAEPIEGYRVKGWLTSTGFIEGSVLRISPEATLTVEPVFESYEVQNPRFPDAAVLAARDFVFDSWDADTAEGVFPPHMVFLQSSMNDPQRDDPVTEPYHIPFTSLADNDYHADDIASVGFPYRLTGRTRINGLGQEGISMINTGRGRDLGAVVAAIDTRGVEKVYVSFTAGTVIPNSRTYGWVLQYAVGFSENWVDVTDESGEAVIYERSNTPGHFRRFTDIVLPDSLAGRPYVQIRWKYYFTGTRLSSESGARDMLRLDDITISAAAGVSSDWLAESLPERVELDQNYPNPFNPVTTFRYRLNEGMTLRLEVYTISGQRVAVLVDEYRSAGEYQTSFNASHLASGVYIYRLQTPQGVHVRKMTLIK